MLIATLPLLIHRYSAGSRVAHAEVVGIITAEYGKRDLQKKIPLPATRGDPNRPESLDGLELVRRAAA